MHRTSFFDGHKKALRHEGIDLIAIAQRFPGNHEQHPPAVATQHMLSVRKRLKSFFSEYPDLEEPYYNFILHLSQPDGNAMNEDDIGIVTVTDILPEELLRLYGEKKELQTILRTRKDRDTLRSTSKFSRIVAETGLAIPYVDQLITNYPQDAVEMFLETSHWNVLHGNGQLRKLSVEEQSARYIVDKLIPIRKSARNVLSGRVSA